MLRCFCIVLFWMGLATSTEAKQAAVIEVDPAQHYQTLEGFGASGAWWAQVVGGWEEEPRQRIVDLLYSSKGIGLSIYRYNIGAGSGQEITDPWRRTESFEVSRGKYDWTRDTNAVRILQEVCSHGIENVVLFANSPPGRMTHSGVAFSKADLPKSNLRKDRYGQFAIYLVDIAEHFVSQGIPVKTLSPINEPQWDWDNSRQEGCHYEPEEVSRLTKLVLRSLEQRKLEVRVEAPESGNWESLGDQDEDSTDGPRYLRALFADSFVFKRLAGFALHSYWSKSDQKRRFAEYYFHRYPEKKLYMTEWCEMKRGRDTSMVSALTLANEVIEDLNLGVSSWQYWIAVSKYNFRDGLIYVDKRNQKMTVTKRLWALGNFSKFIRPGYIHCEATTSANLKVLAATSPNSSRTIVVVANSNDHQVRTRIESKGLGIAKKYETSADRDLTEVSRGDSRVADFAPQSVTTLVLE